MKQFYNPDNLPDRLNFLKATREFPLSRANKTKLQIAFSKMNKTTLKKTIKHLRDLEYECLDGKKRIDWENIEKDLKDKNSLAKIPLSLQDDFRMAVWCKFCADFAEKYLYSLEQQKKI